MIDSLINFRKIEAKSVNNINKDKMYLLRGGPLDEISEEDQLKLSKEYNLKTVIDFRSKDEIKAAPNKKIKGVDYYNIEALDPNKSVHKNPTEFFQAYNSKHDLSFMEELYSEFVLNAFSRASFSEFLKIVSNSKGSVYFHCTAGKDRTGFAAMLLLEILGASEIEIYQDYLKTNQISDKNYKVILKRLRKHHDYLVEDQLLKDLIGVRQEYLETSINLINDEYGSVNNYIKYGLNINNKTINLIKNKYVV